MTVPGVRIRVPRTVRSQQFIFTFAVIFALIAALLALDFFLARIDREENRRHAENLFRDGRALLASGHSAEAVDKLATAVSLARSNSAYGLALAQAMMANGRDADSEQLLKQLLDRAPDDGGVSLTMARLLVKTGRPNDAKAFFHRAIYGKWGSDSTTQRMKSRFELIDLLARRGAREELLAELLPLQSEAGDSTMLLRRVAPLYITAGSPEHGADLYRDILKRDPHDRDATLGLTNADIALGQLRQARTDLSRAVREFPGDTIISRQLVYLDSAFALDPSSRRISDAERFKRSRNVLGRTLAFVERCSAQSQAVVGRTLQDSARANLEATKSARWSASSVEGQISLSEELWAEAQQQCGTNTAIRDSVLEFLQRLLAP